MATCPTEDGKYQPDYDLVDQVFAEEEPRRADGRLADDDDEDDKVVHEFADDDDDDEYPKTLHAPKGQKRKRCDIDPKQLSLARKRLFAGGTERRTMSTFYVEGEMVNMEDPESCADQRKLFARIFNTLLYFSQCRVDERNPEHRGLAMQAQLTVKRLKKLMDSGFKEYYLSITSAVIYLLRAMADIQYYNKKEVLVQFAPVTCTIDRSVQEKLNVNGLELREVNSSLSLSVNTSPDLKFLYAGQIRVKSVQDQTDKHYVSPSACMGDYMNAAIHELYDCIYDRTVQYIKSFYNRYPEDCAETKESAPCDGFAELAARNIYSGSNKAKAKEAKERQILSYLLRSVGREVNLKKVDLDRNSVFVLTSSVNKKQKYLRAGSDLTCSVSSTPIVGAEGVFLSSFVRTRIMEDGSLNFQVYSRTCMYICDNSEFP